MLWMIYWSTNIRLLSYVLLTGMCPICDWIGPGSLTQFIPRLCNHQVSNWLTNHGHPPEKPWSCGTWVIRQKEMLRKCWENLSWKCCEICGALICFIVTLRPWEIQRRWGSLALLEWGTGSVGGTVGTVHGKWNVRGQGLTSRLGGLAFLTGGAKGLWLCGPGNCDPRHGYWIWWLRCSNYAWVSLGQFILE